MKEKDLNYFRSAKPIWTKEHMGQCNYMVGFRTVLELSKVEEVILKITVATLYRVYVNGEFMGYGPARAARGYFRVDELNLSKGLVDGENIIAIEVAVYNTETSYIMEQPEFLQAELTCGGRIIASTSGEGVLFEPRLCSERVQKVPRLSFQRGFVEYYRLTNGFHEWTRKKDCDFKTIPWVEVSKVNLLPRVVDYPDYTLRMPVKEVSRGTFEEDTASDASWMPSFTPMVGRITKGYSMEEIEVNPILDQQRIKSVKSVEGETLLTHSNRVELSNGEYQILDFGTNLSGFIGAKVIAREKTKIILLFDEMLIQGDVDLKRAGLNTLIGYELEEGVYNLEAFETYTLKYLKIMVLKGQCSISNIYIREYANPSVYKAQFSCNDRKLNRLFEGGRETLRQNALDVFTDCPSRERGGYLCDSFFTARACFNLTGNTKVERNFVENYLLPDSFPKLPDGMIPMCYPADVKVNYRNFSSPYGMFIPNWSLWFIVQLDEYITRSGDLEIVEQLKPRVLSILDYFKKFENEDGLLEKLEGWVFIEWSKANHYVQDVNYPSNMLYAGALDVVGRLYNRHELIEQSNSIKEVIRRQSYDGTFFIDNAVRENGELKPTKNKTEVCQYYAFFFGIAEQKTHEVLWNRLVTEFGPKRKETKSYPEVDPANAFIGNFLRLDLLSRYSMGNQLVEESSDYFMYMIEKTGTLWEHIDETASCNHGFGSHIVYWLYKNVLGINSIDMLNKTIRLRFEASDLNWSEGRIPLTDGNLSVRWWKEDNIIYYNIELPAGFKFELENKTGLYLVRIV